MIDSIRGTILHKAEDWVVVEVGGLGFKVMASPVTLESLPAAGEECQLHTAFVVREDAFSLYGFSSQSEKDMFDLLLGVSQVGPRVALSALGCFRPQELREALYREDIDILTRIPGVGPKTARRLVLELKDRVEGLPGPPTEALAQPLQEAISALRALGYAAQEAQEACRAARESLGDESEVEALIREGLGYLLDRSRVGRS